MIIELLIFAVAFLLVLSLLVLLRSRYLYKRDNFPKVGHHHHKSPTEKLHDMLFRRD